MVIMTCDQYPIYVQRLQHVQNIVVDANRMKEMCLLKIPLAFATLVVVARFFCSFAREVRKIRKFNKANESLQEIRQTSTQ